MEEINQNLLTNLLEKSKNYSIEDFEELEALIFGRKITPEGQTTMSLFEKILRKYNTVRLTNLIWVTFQLWRKGYILNLVSFD